MDLYQKHRYESARKPCGAGTTAISLDRPIRRPVQKACKPKFHTVAVNSFRDRLIDQVDSNDLWTVVSKYRSTSSSGLQDIARNERSQARGRHHDLFCKCKLLKAVEL